MTWITTVDADAYFLSSLDTAKWAAVANQSGAINSAFRILSTHPKYSFPATAEQAMKDANSEFALYLATTSTKRQNLIEQGVKSFSVGDFSETLQNMNDGSGTNIILPSIVKQYLEPYEVGVPFIGYVDRPITRLDR